MRPLISLVFFTTLLFSIWMWQPNSFAFQAWVQMGFCVLILAGLAVNLRRINVNSSSRFILDEDGDWLDLSSFALTNHEQHQHWRITPQSKVSSHCLWVELVKIDYPHSKRSVIFMRDELMTRDFHRLARTIAFCQKKPYQAITAVDS